jgi:hypothetical protein
MLNSCVRQLLGLCSLALIGLVTPAWGQEGGRTPAGEAAEPGAPTVDRSATTELESTGPEPEPDSAAGDSKPWRGPPQEAKFEFDLYQRVKLRADLDKGDASVAVYRTGGSASFSKFFGYIRLGAKISGERSKYDFKAGEEINSPPDPPAPDEPWDVLSFVRLNMNVLVPLGRSNWSIFAFGGVRFGWETGTDLDDGLSGSFAASVGYRVDERLTLQFGALLITRIEGDPLVVPLIGLRWTPTDWLRVETRGPGIEGGLKPWSWLELTLGVRYDNRQFRLEEEREILASHIVEDQEVVVEFGLDWSPWDWLSFRGVAGFVAYQEFEVRDDDGDTVYKSRTDLAPYLELTLALTF